MIVEKSYSQLSLDELYKILRLRAEVFVVEQDCPYQDLDDNDQAAEHIFAVDGGNVAAYLRVFVRADGNVAIGRVVTSKKVRGTGLGKRLVLAGLEFARQTYPGRRCVLHSQCYAIGFYEKCGFSVCSDEFLEDGIPHKEMSLML